VWGLAPAILDGQRKGPPTPPTPHRTAMPGGPARSGRGAPTRPRQRSGSLFSIRLVHFCGATIREQLAIATVAFAISFVAITEVLLSLM
jgi:hypothetical protein